jgi:hypothetical protein
LTATNFATGSDVEKPALWVDGNLHAPEVAGSMAVLYFINTLVTRYGQDTNLTTALTTPARSLRWNRSDLVWNTTP